VESNFVNWIALFCLLLQVYGSTTGAPEERRPQNITRQVGSGSLVITAWICARAAAMQQQKWKQHVGQARTGTGGRDRSIGDGRWLEEVHRTSCGVVQIPGGF
jgi:hypothetical protein